MKYLWYGFLGLFSIGLLGLAAAILGVFLIFNYYGHDLPDYQQLKDYKPPIVTRLYAGDGRLMAEFAQEKRIFVPINKIPDLVKNGFIAAEDKNFYQHEGVDMIAVVRAAVSNFKNLGSGRRPEGASTITQQVAKNFLLTNEVSYERKIKEAILAYRMEQAFTKERLLELYLNEIYLGARSYGVAAAALQYFNKSLSELSVAEIAYLAALPKAPNNYHPIRKHDAAVARRNWVIGRMRDDGYITAEQEQEALKEPLDYSPREDSGVVDASFFAEEVRRELAGKYGEESLYGGGLVVRTTLDPKLQDIAQKSLQDGLEAYDHRHGWRGPLDKFDTLDDWKNKLAAYTTPLSVPDDWRVAVVIDVEAGKASIGLKDGARGTIPLEHAKWARESRNEGYSLGPEVTSIKQVLNAGDIIVVKAVEEAENQYSLKQIPLIQGAIIAIDPHTGRILAMQGGWKYGVSEFNRATQAARQPGSAFKPFVYAAALESGFTPATLILDAPFEIEDRPGNVWRPTNYSGEFYGPTPLRVGIEKSKNLMTVRLADYLGIEKIVDYAKRFGVDENMQPHLANALGAGETTLMDITSAYGVFVNGGKKITPTFIDRIQDRRGDTIFQHDERPCQDCGDRMRWQGQVTPPVLDTREQILDSKVAYQMVSILEGVVQRGTGARIKDLGFPLAGKTGTTNKSKDTWFIGFSPDLVVGVFAGFDEPRSLGKRETGSSVSVPIFKEFMREALKDKLPMPFRIPKGIKNVQVNALTGARAKPGDEKVIWEAFIAGSEPTDTIYILDEYGISVMPSYTDFGSQNPYAPYGLPQQQQGQAQDQGWDENIPVYEDRRSLQGVGGLY